jgi:hypothetical protein
MSKIMQTKPRILFRDSKHVFERITQLKVKNPEIQTLKQNLFTNFKKISATKEESFEIPQERNSKLI